MELPIIEIGDPTPQPKRPEASGPQRGTYAVVSLGCPKNLVDTERMLGLLEHDGYHMVPQAEGADFVIINTCGFISAARDESYAAIQEMIELKQAGKLKGVVVSGCLAERQKDSLLEELPQIDHVVGVFGREEISRVADRMIGGLEEQRTVFRPAPARALDDSNRLRVTPRHMAYMKISEGCDRLCTFCAIPQMRGKHASKPIEQVLAEARQLAADGVRELNIVAQDTTYYGMDIYGEPRLAELLRQLDEIDGIEWIRLLYLYPMYFTDELLETLAGMKRLVPYLDMPLQHADDVMLKRMARKVTREETETLLTKIRQALPNAVLRTTFITGFPGETEDQFQTLVEFTEKHRFERMGVFTYSYEPTTPSAKLPDHLDEAVKEDRRERLMLVQQEIAFRWNEQLIGQQMDVLIDANHPEQDEVYLGRTFADAPDIDGLVYVTSPEPLAVGSLVPCEIVASQGYDLIAVPVGDPH